VGWKKDSSLKMKKKGGNSPRQIGNQRLVVSLSNHWFSACRGEKMKRQSKKVSFVAQTTKLRCPKCGKTMRQIGWLGIASGQAVYECQKCGIKWHIRQIINAKITPFTD
jgi:DNA-directed RNA polymerase subunit RPC12/RpoP